MDDSLYETYLENIPLTGLNVCRFCVTNKVLMKPISLADSGIFDLFKQVTQIKLEISNDYPPYICNDCEDILNASAKHIQKFREVDAFWKKYLLNKSGNCQDVQNDFERAPMELVKVEDSYNHTEDNDDNDDDDDDDYVDDDDSEMPAVFKPHFVKVEMSESSEEPKTQTNKLPRLETASDKKVEKDSSNFECAICGKNVRSKSILEYHIKNYHDVNKSVKEEFICDHCGEKCSSAMKLQQHINSHKDFTCPICGQGLPSSRHMKAHVKEHKRKTPVADGLFSCTACFETFNDKASFRDHVRSTHLIMQESKCTKCDKVCSSQNRLRKHMMKRHNERPVLQCWHCNKEFPDKSQLKQHMRTHITEGEKYICDVCGHEFKSLNSVNRHSLIHSQGNCPETLNDRRRPLQSAAGHLKCKLCSKMFTRLPALRQHLKKDHPFDGPMLWEQTMACLKCNEIFPSAEILRDHRESHNHFQCDVCKQYMTSQEALNYHVLTHSAKDRPYKCTICGATYIQNTHLAQHMRRAHTRERNHKCIVCHKTFVENYELVKHNRIVHMQERRFPCKLCDKTYKKSNELKIHLQSHTGVYRYRCDICNKGFGNSTRFATHNAAAHPPNA